jgi:polar amino acid transport system ATP-binding protein/sulfate transport system ATP-binding protein
MIAYEKQDVILEIDHVSLTLGGNLILRDVSATIQNIVRPDCAQGQVICFLGPSGIGKTQLSHVLTGLRKPTSGTVRVWQPLEGSRTGAMSLQPVRCGLVGMVQQAYPLFPFATVEDNLIIAGQQAGLSPKAIQDRGLSYLNDLGVYEYRKYYPKSISGGTRQRVAIAQQLMCSDHFIVLDEPFASLDPNNKKRACDVITKVATRDELNTLIVITHDIPEGLSVADEVWLMGLEPDPDHPGKYLPGARLVEQYDLAKLDLCWHPDIKRDPRFVALVAEIDERFLTLGK